MVGQKLINTHRPQQIIDLLVKVDNPIPLFLDRLGLKSRPYTVATRDKFLCELRPGCGDRYGFYETLIRRDYLFKTHRLNKGDVIIDIGANIGCFSILAADIVGAEGRVIAVEPEENTNKQLLHNIELNKLFQIQALCLAIGGQEAMAELKVSSNSLFTSLFDKVDGREDLAKQSTQTVKVITLEQLFAQQQLMHCHYLKMDCEGAEYEIIGTLTPSLAAQIDQWAIETHEVPGHSRDQLIERLKSLGYNVSNEKLLFAWR